MKLNIYDGTFLVMRYDPTWRIDQNLNWWNSTFNKDEKDMDTLRNMTIWMKLNIYDGFKSKYDICFGYMPPKTLIKTQ